MRKERQEKTQRAGSSFWLWKSSQERSYRRKKQGADEIKRGEKKEGERDQNQRGEAKEGAFFHLGVTGRPWLKRGKKQKKKRKKR
jgi:hypothetical protein